MLRSKRSIVAAVSFLLATWAGDAHGEVIMPLQLDVEVNGQPKDMLAGFKETSPGRLAALRRDLVALGLAVPGTGGDQEIIDLDRLAGITYQYDEARQAVRFKVPPEGFQPQTFDARYIDEAREPATSATGGLLDYSLVLSAFQDTSGGTTDPLTYDVAGAFVARYFSQAGEGEAGFIAGTELQNGVPAIRLDTAWMHTDDDSMIEYRYGDNISGSLTWSRPIRFAGVRMHRNFALRPDYVAAPLPVVTGSAAVPSTVEVYVDNLKAYSRDVGPGPFTISNVPIMGGGLARIVVRDSAGRVTESTLPFYSSPILLREGLFDFSLEAGFPRRNFGVHSFDYEMQPVGSASGRYGLTGRLTLEGHAEIGLGTVNAGVGAVFAAQETTLINLGLSVSSFDQSEAARAFAGVSAKWKGVALSWRSERTFGSYVDLAAASVTVAEDAARTAKLLTSNSAKAFDVASISFPVPLVEGSLSLSAIRTVAGDDEVRQTMSAFYNRPIGRDTSFFATAYHELDERSSALFVGVSHLFGDNLSAAASVAHDRSGMNAHVEFARSAGSEVGSYGWRTTLTRGSTKRISAGGTYRTAAADVQALAVKNDSGTWLNASVTGALVAMGGEVRATNMLHDAFALVDVGVPDIEVQINNRPIGKTDASGRVFAPGLLSQLSNKITFDPTILPPDTEASVTTRNVNPKRRSGVIVDMKVRPAQPSALVQFVLPEGEPVPAGALGKLDGQDEEFFVGYDGQAFIPRLGATNKASIQYDDKSCTASFSFTAKPGEQVQINSVLCK